MDALISDVKPMRIPRPKFCCAKSTLMYPVEPPKDYLDLEGDHHLLLQQPARQQLKGSVEGGVALSASQVEELGRALKEKVKV
ncbi:uncharacterized protein LOC127004789 [Eriocheir sinensis]|uniref:uncharacterized protein LOC127004789 n=1 Tax=Eriocheir sinensis TaxID=95602 RepID=UPI0021C9FD27|nr:uncharacterized protein LOC127004789 [Eriocheir sinensis]